MGESRAIVAAAGKAELHGPIDKLLALAFVVVLLGVAAGLSTAVTTRELTRPVRALLERERRLAQALTDYLPEFVALKDRDGRYQFVNKTYELWTGTDRSDLIGNSVQDLYPDDHARDIVGRDEIAAASSGPVSFEADREYADGVVRSVQITLFPVRDERGEFVGLGTIHHDLTEARGRERRIRQHSHFVQALHAATAAANEAPSLDEAIRVCLDCICSETGWPVGHAFLISDTDDKRLVPSNVWRTGDATQFGLLRKVAAVTRLSSGEGLPARAFQSGEIEWIPDLKAGDNLPRAAIMSEAGIQAGFTVPVRAGEGVAAVLEFYTDTYAQPSAQAMDLLKNISSQLGSLMLRKLAHNGLRASEKRLLRILDDSPAGATITSPGGETLFSNNRMGELLGEHWSEGVAGGRVLDRIAPRLSEALRRELQARGRVSEREAKIRLDDSTTFWAAVSLTSLDYQNQPCVLTWVYDVSVHKQAQSKLEAQSQFLGNVLENLAQGVVVYDSDRRIRAWNSNVETILRVRPGTLRAGMEMAELLGECVASATVDGVPLNPEARANEVWGSERTQKTVAIDERVFDVSSHRTDDGGLLMTWSDVTERRAAEQLAVEQREWLQQVVDQMPVGVVVYDKDERVRLFKTAQTRSSLDKGSDFRVSLPLSIGDAQAVTEHRDVLSDVYVVVTAKDDAQLEACTSYVTSAGATVHKAALTPLHDAPSQIPDGIPTSKLVVVCMCDFDAAEIPALRSMWLAQSSAHSVRFVITNGGATAGNGLSEWDDVVTVESHPLRRHSLITAIEMAAGKASPRALTPPLLLNVSRAAVPTAAKALANGQIILVAEDNVTNQDVIRRQLHALGYQCEIAEDGAEALTMWKAKNYAILLSDCHMPRMDGFELTAAVRFAEAGSHEHLPIVAITANALEGEAERCLAAGMDEYLSKPFQIRRLKEVLAANIGPPKNAAPPAEQPPTASALGVDAANADAVRVGASPIDGSVLLEMFDGDEETVRKVLEGFMHPTWNVVSEIEQAWQIRSADGVKRASHKLKSSARSIGANTLADLCEGLESAGRETDWARLDAGIARVGGHVREVETYINVATG
jgi:PAS domain S-box-containing protein